MKQTTRELLITTKVAQSWEDDFDRNVDGLMSIVSKVDNFDQVDKSTELLDVYSHTPQDSAKSSKKKKVMNNERPFEFIVFRN